MSFGTPLMLLGVAGAAVPLLIHLIGRRRAPRRRFAAIDFVLRSDRRLARRLKLREWLLLAVRMVLAGAIATMMAKPFALAESELPAVSGGPQSVVLVLDDTLSMRRRVGGTTLFRHATRKARALVAMLRVGQAELAVLSLSDPTGPLLTLTREPRKVLAAIDSVEAGQGHAVISGALVVATRILAESALPSRRVFVLTDAAAHGLPDRRRPEPLPKGIELQLVDVAPEAPVDNHAVVELAASPSTAPGQRTTRIRARICNHGAAPLNAKATLSINGKEVARGFHQQGPWSCGPKTFDHSFVRGGMHNAVISLEPDALPEDDLRYLRLEVESSIRVLLVNGAPSPVRHRDELFYLGTALATGGPAGQPILSKTITAAELGQARLPAFDVVALCNVRGVPAARAAELKAFVQKGGGLLVTVGENVDPEQYNATLGDLLPAGLRGPLTAAPPGTGAPALRIGRVDSAHPILGPIWSEKEGAGLRNARFRRVYRLRPATQGDKRVVLWYDDGSPALVEARRGEGRVLLFTSTVDRDWNDLAIRPGYLPLLQQMVRHLSRVAIHAPRRDLEVGGTVSFRPSKGTRQLRLTGPGGIELLWTAKELARKSVVEIPVPAPGFYKLSAAGADGVLHPMDRESFMANVSPLESDLRKVEPAAGGDRPASGEMARAKRRVELWHGLGALLLLLLLVESYITRRG